MLIAIAFIIVSPLYLPKKQISSTGITILSTTLYPESLDRFILVIYDISQSDSSAKGELYIALNFTKPPNVNDMLVFVIPYELRNCKVKHSDPEARLLSVQYNHSLEASYISIALKPQMKKFELTLEFTLHNCLKWVSFDTFDLIIPLGITDIRIIQQKWLGDVLTIDPTDFKYIRISISDPVGCKSVLYHPQVSKVYAFEGRIWNSWIIDGKSASPPLALVRAEYLSESLTSEKDLRIFLAGTLLSLGASVIVSTILHERY